MIKITKNIISIALVLAIASGFIIVPASAATVADWGFVGFTRVSDGSTSETINDGSQNPTTSLSYNMSGSLYVYVKTGSITGFQISIDGNAVGNASIERNSYVDPVSKLNYWISTIHITNASQYLNSNLNTHLFKVTTKQTTASNSPTSANTLFIKPSSGTQQPGQAPNVGYNHTNHWLTGLNSSMEWRFWDTSWSSWFTPTTSTVNILAF